MSNLQKRVIMHECILLVIVLTTIFMIYAFSVMPINRRHEAALNHFLAKEIARRLYQEIHPKFSYKVYHEDDLQRQMILNSALEEFKRLLNKKNE